jgi:hypothetical protein
VSDTPKFLEHAFEYRATLPSGRIAIAHGVLVKGFDREPYAIAPNGEEIELTNADKRWIDPCGTPKLRLLQAAVILVK